MTNKEILQKYFGVSKSALYKGDQKAYRKVADAVFHLIATWRQNPLKINSNPAEAYEGY